MIVFNSFRLDPDRRVLLSESGTPVALPAPAFDMLVCLVEGRDRVQSKKDIIERVWKGRTVSDNNVTVQMSTLRRALAEHGGDGLIATIANEGYRFVGEAADAATAEPHPTPIAPASIDAGHVPDGRVADAWSGRVRTEPAGRLGRVWAISAAAMAGLIVVAGIWWRGVSVPPPPRLSIAVMPFDDFSSTPGHGYLAEAISDDLTTDLAHIPGSTVVTRSSVAQFRGRSVTMAEVGRSLNVRYVLNGSLAVEGAMRLVNAQLGEVKTGKTVWGQRFTIPQDGLADAQTAIVRRIASALDSQLTAFEGARALRERPSDPDAEDLFYGARTILDRDDSLAGFTRAQTMLEQAVRLAPNFWDAAAQLGLTLLLKIRSNDDPVSGSDIIEARAMIAAALAAPRPSAMAYAADARLREGDGDCVGAGQSAATALQLEPNSIDALTVLARCSANAGRLEEAVGYEETAMRLNPASGQKGRFFLMLGQLKLMQGRYGDAMTLAHLATNATDRLQSSEDCMGRVEYANILLLSATALSGDVAGAHQLYADYAARWPNRSVWRIGTYAARQFAALPGYRNFLTGLRSAGMPFYAAEPAGGASPLAACSEFAATPQTVAGAQTIDTAALVAMLARSYPIIIDVGPGAAVIPGADWIGDHPSGTTVRDLVERSKTMSRRSAIVIMGSGIYGTASYNGVRSLVAAGYQTVLWYRGGEEAWSEAGQTSSDRRLQL